MDHILSIVLLAPLAGLLVLLLIPSSKPKAIKLWANVWSFLCFLPCLWLVFQFDSAKDFQFVERAEWIPSIGASYYLAIDGYSLLLVALTGLLGFLAILSSWNAIDTRLKEYYANFLFLQASMLGVFMARDFLLFFVFWELGLVPMYFIIAIWGGPRRVYSAFKFLVYTFIGSVVMFLGILALYSAHYREFQSYSFAIPDLLRTALSGNLQWWIFWAFFLGFAVKVPMWPLHTWLPDAHTEAPTAGSVVLASVLLKMGTYGFLRFSLPLLPNAAGDSIIVNAMALLSIVAIVYGALVCLMQKDWKKLIAYSSVSHLGFCTLGIFALNPAGIAGSMLQQINHGISTGMLFLIVGVAYERRHTREIAEYGGLMRAMPVFTMVFFHRAQLDGHARAERFHRRVLDPARRIPNVLQLGVLVRGGDRTRRGLPDLAVPADHAGGDFGEERETPRPLAAGDRGVRPADRLGLLDRGLSQAVLPGAGASRGADRRAGEPRLLCQARPA